MSVVILAAGCGPSVAEQSGHWRHDDVVRRRRRGGGRGGRGGGVGGAGAGGSAAGGAGGGPVEARLAQGMPECVVRHGAVDCYAPPAGRAVDVPEGLWHVLGIDDALEVTCALEETCVRRASGEVWCWGFNDHGQLGLAVLLGAGTSVPVQLPKVNVVKLATAEHALCGSSPRGR